VCRLFRIGEGLRVGAAMADRLNRAEHYRKQAETYHELAKFAEPAYLGDFYRGVAVRYVFMSQEISKQAEKDVGSAAEPTPAVAGDDEQTTRLARGLDAQDLDAQGFDVLDLDLLSVWAGERSRSGDSK
jgi:hypothetical protein